MGKITNISPFLMGKIGKAHEKHWYTYLIMSLCWAVFCFPREPSGRIATMILKVLVILGKVFLTHHFCQSDTSLGRSENAWNNSWVLAPMLRKKHRPAFIFRSWVLLIFCLKRYPFRCAIKARRTMSSATFLSFLIWGGSSLGKECEVFPQSPEPKQQKSMLVMLSHHMLSWIAYAWNMNIHIMH